jgi:hypothetical protein
VSSTISSAAAQSACADEVVFVENFASYSSVGLSLATQDDRIFAAASSTTAPFNRGVHVLERQASGAWLGVGAFETPIDIVVSDDFGRAIAASGDYAAVSAPNDDPLGTNSGSVFVYERDAGSTWTLVQTLVNPPEGPSTSVSAGYGLQLVMEGDLLIVSSPRNTTKLFDEFGIQTGQVTTGAVFIYRRAPSGLWLLEQKLRPSPLFEDTQFGQGVALRDGRLHVGAFGEKAFGTTTGSVTVFESDGFGSWVVVDKIFHPQFADDSQFGAALATDGSTLVVGAPAERRAHVFTRSPSGAWQFDETLAPPVFANDWGAAVAVRGDALVVGSNGATNAVTHLFERGAGMSWFLSLRLAACSVNPAAVPGAGVAIIDDAFVFGAPAAVESAPGSGAIHFVRRGTLYHSVIEDSTVLPTFQDLLLRAGPEWANAPYLVLGSLSGTSPSTPVAPGVELPLVFDAYTQMTLALTAPIDDAFDVLRENGDRTARFETPTGLYPAFSGLVLHHAFVAVQPVTFELFVSNPVPLRLIP